MNNKGWDHVQIAAWRLPFLAEGFPSLSTSGSLALHHEGLGILLYLFATADRSIH